VSGSEATGSVDTAASLSRCFPASKEKRGVDWGGVGHRLLLSLPAVAAAIVAWAVLGAGGSRVRYVQVLGGPTASVSSLLLRSLEQGRDGRVAPSPHRALRVTLQSGDVRATVAGTTDATGQLELRLDAEPSPAVDRWLRVEATGAAEVLAEGSLALDPERWRSAARRSGGWLSGQTRGTLGVRVAAESGTFAVPFEGALVVQVLEPRAEGSADANDAARPRAGARIEVELDGAALAGPPPLSMDTGLSRVVLRPEEHAVSARVVARAGDRQGEWYGVLPVTPGALWAAREGDVLLVRSPIARGLAFASIVTRNERLAGAIVPLTAADDGSASGRWALHAGLLERLEREACWVVVSSEYDKRSAGAVGWPLSPPGFDPAAPRLSFDVADAVLLDGRAEAVVAAERERSGRRRSAALALLAVGVLMSASFWKEVRRGRIGTASSDDRLAPRADDGGAHPARSDPGRTDLTPLAASGWVLAVALACILLGLGGLAYFGLTH